LVRGVAVVRLRLRDRREDAADLNALPLELFAHVARRHERDVPPVVRRVFRRLRSGERGRGAHFFAPISLLKISPPFITNLPFSSSLTSFSGSPDTAIMSA